MKPPQNEPPIVAPPRDPIQQERRALRVLMLLALSVLTVPAALVFQFRTCAALMSGQEFVPDWISPTMVLVFGAVTMVAWIGLTVWTIVRSIRARSQRQR